MIVGVFSDTHGLHGLLKPEDFTGIDLLIFAGDESKARIPAINVNETLNFHYWYETIDVKYKIWVAGNHSTAIEAKLIRPKDICKSIIYLDHESVEIEGIKIFGSQYTTTFGIGWAFNVKPHKIDNYWKEIPENTDILITHGPPKGILDLSYNKDRVLERCGDKSLLNHVLRVKPQYHIFGHIHDYEDCYNQGLFYRDGISFMNVSCVRDGRFDLGLTSRIKRFEI
jgi:Icc-related predicted phosphoesterase